MLVKRRTMRKMWALFSVFVLTFVVMIAGAGAMPGIKSVNLLSWFKLW